MELWLIVALVLFIIGGVMFVINKAIEMAVVCAGLAFFVLAFLSQTDVFK